MPGGQRLGAFGNPPTGPTPVETETAGVGIAGLVGASVPIVPPSAAVLFGGLGGSNTTTDLYSIDPADGSATSIGACGFGLTGLAFRPSDGVLFGTTNNNSAANPVSLITINPLTGAGTLVGSLGGPTIPDISFRSDDVLFGYHSGPRTLHTINTSTGAATQVSSTAVPGIGFGYGITFDASDVLYLFPKGDQNIYYIVNPATGGLTAQPTLTGSPLIGEGQVSAACFDADGLVWINDIGFSPADTWIATVDVGASAITGVGVTTRGMDALTVQLP